MLRTFVRIAFLLVQRTSNKRATGLSEKVFGRLKILIFYSQIINFLKLSGVRFCGGPSGSRRRLPPRFTESAGSTLMFAGMFVFGLKRFEAAMDQLPVHLGPRVVAEHLLFQLEKFRLPFRTQRYHRAFALYYRTRPLPGVSPYHLYICIHYRVSLVHLSTISAPLLLVHHCAIMCTKEAIKWQRKGRDI